MHSSQKNKGWHTESSLRFKYSLSRTKKRPKSHPNSLWNKYQEAIIRSNLWKSFATQKKNARNTVIFYPLNSWLAKDTKQQFTASISKPLSIYSWLLFWIITVYITRDILHFQGKNIIEPLSNLWSEHISDDTTVLLKTLWCLLFSSWIKFRFLSMASIAMCADLNRIKSNIHCKTENNNNWIYWAYIRWYALHMWYAFTPTIAYYGCGHGDIETEEKTHRLHKDFFMGSQLDDPSQSPLHRVEVIWLNSKQWTVGGSDRLHF